MQGTYKLEVWGAQGGTNGGKGGYSFGKISSSQGKNIYVCCGGAGKSDAGTGHTANTQNPGGEGGYNGGGNGGKGFQAPGYNYRIYGGGGGGGCTHIAITNRGELYRYENNKSDILLVAGGGGGGNLGHGIGGCGGGLSGGASVYTDTVTGTSYTSEGATQTNGYKFGIGQQGMDKTIDGYAGGEGNGGGGGGWYGGFSIQVQGHGSDVGGGGGSGHVGNVTDGQTLAGNTAFPSPNGGTETGHEGSGWAKISW